MFCERECYCRLPWRRIQLTKGAKRCCDNWTPWKTRSSRNHGNSAMSYIIIRKKAPYCKPCDKCDREIEVFSHDAAEASFLIVRLADRPFLGGGKCLTCGQNVCISCAINTVYGRGLRRLHCP